MALMSSATQRSFSVHLEIFSIFFDLATMPVDLATRNALCSPTFAASIFSQINILKMDKKKIWFVTGASKGLGLTLIKKLLENGYQVAATSRDVKTLNVEVGNSTPNFLPLQVDLLNEESVVAAINCVIQKFGGVDVVVNNAGYAQLGTLEELSDKEARQN